MPRGTRGRRGALLVTVGTTRFEALVAAVSSAAFVAAVKARGYSTVLVQIGKGACKPAQGGAAPARPEEARGGFVDAETGVRVEWFRFAPSLDEHVKSADLVVSHAGAGSVFEALRAKKPLVVAVNAALMDNHQAELAHALAKKGHLVATDPDGVAGAVRDLEPESLVPYEAGSPAPFAAALDELMGFPPAPAAADAADAAATATTAVEEPAEPAPDAAGPAKTPGRTAKRRRRA